MIHSFDPKILSSFPGTFFDEWVNEVLALHLSLLIIVLSMAFVQGRYFHTLSSQTFARVVTNVMWGALAHLLLLTFQSEPLFDTLGRNFTFRSFWLKVSVGYIFADMMYYTIHRVLHWKFFFRHIHRVHHETPQSGPLTALDVHPLEYVFAQLSTELMSGWVVGATLPELCFLSSVAKVFAMYSHSRSEGKAWISVMEHEAHHRDGRHNFGVTGLMDWVFGTMK